MPLNKSKKTDKLVTKPLLEELLDVVMPNSIPRFAARLILLKLIYSLVRDGLMKKGNADTIKRSTGPRSSYVPPSRKTINAGEVDAFALTEDVENTINQLASMTFPEDRVPTKTTYDGLIGLAKRRGIPEKAVRMYLLDLLDEETLIGLGLKEKED